MQRSEKATSGRKNKLQKVEESDPNYTDLSQTNSISQSSDGVTDEVLAYIKLIRGNLDYDYHMKYNSRYDREMFKEIYNIINNAMEFVTRQLEEAQTKLTTVEHQLETNMDKKGEDAIGMDDDKMDVKITDKSAARVFFRKDLRK